MAAEKENFLERWSRVKREQEAKAPAPQSASQDGPPALPPIDQLTPESDFSAFMHPKVGDALRRAALKKLFSDPHFNVPDPFEPFSGDWTVGEAIPPDMLAGLNQARTLLFPEKDKKEDQAKQAAEDQPENPAKKDDEPGRQDA